jgi:hypothetical protein
MIKRCSTFNESNSVDNFKSEVENIRNYFIEFEDSNSVSYEMKVIGKSEVDMMWSINPNSGAFDRWLSGLTEEANRYLNNEDYRKLFLRGSEGAFGKYPFCFCVSIKLPGEIDTEHFGSNCTISEQGIDVLEDVLVAYKRLKDDLSNFKLFFYSGYRIPSMNFKCFNLSFISITT